MNYWNGIINSLKVILNWPVLIGILIFIYRKQISYLLNIVIDNLKRKGVSRVGPVILGPETIHIESFPPALYLIPEEYENREFVISSLFPKFQKLSREADLAEIGKDYLGALGKYKMAFEYFPFNPIVCHNIAAIQIRIYKDDPKSGTGLLDEAIKYAKFGIFLSPQMPSGTLYNLARAQSLANDLENVKLTLSLFRHTNIPKNLYMAIKDDPDFTNIKGLREFGELLRHFGH